MTKSILFITAFTLSVSSICLLSKGSNRVNAGDGLTTQDLPLSEDTKRVWAYVDSSWAVDTLVVHDEDSPAEGNYLMHPVSNKGADDFIYYYADVPLDLEIYAIATISDGQISNKSVTQVDDKYLSEYPTWEIAYVSYDGLTVVFDTPSSSKAILAGRVIEGYRTCLDNDVNGYKAINDIKEAYIDNLVDSTELADFYNTPITDYDENGEVSEDAVTAGDKYDAMMALYNGDKTATVNAYSSIGNVKAFYALLLITGIVMALLSFIGVAALYRKKKQR